MIVLKNVYKCYKTEAQRIDALRDISLHVKAGECVLLKGASGSGKSTILSLIAGLSKPTTGDVVVDGKRISKLMEPFSAHFRRENIGFIFQRYHLIPTLSVRDNIALPLIPENLTAQVMEKRIQEVMQLCAISHKASALCRHLSGGEQQRVAIARALVNEPKIIIADEPTANLDAVLSEQFIETMHDLKKRGVTLLIATHDSQFFNLPFVDQQIELKNGVMIS